jgi:hypothetical protein
LNTRCLRGPPLGGLVDQELERTCPFGSQTEDLLEIRLRLGIAALEQQGQAPPRIGDQVAGVDPDVLAAVIRASAKVWF